MQGIQAGIADLKKQNKLLELRNIITVIMNFIYRFNSRSHRDAEKTKEIEDSLKKPRKVAKREKR